ncbi:MAG: PorT family protein [Candidatus Moranbacteria bacterium]|nr:PorT family protein [Candidatus Moranbacteria bacterium]
MKLLKLFGVGLFCFFCNIAISQISKGDYTEILLKSGYTVRGKVIENVQGEKLTLETLDGTNISYRYDEIEKFGKQTGKSKKSTVASGFSLQDKQLSFLANVGIGLSGLTNKKECYGCEPKSVFKFPALFGFGVKVDLDTLFSLNGELNFERKGYKITSSSEESKFQLSYLTLPLYATINLPYENLIIFGQAGGYAALKLKEKQKDDDSHYNSSYNRHKDIDFGWLIGAGIEIPYQEQIKVRAQLRHARGFRRALDDIKMRNSTFLGLISVIYQL